MAGRNMGGFDCPSTESVAWKTFAKLTHETFCDKRLNSKVTFCQFMSGFYSAAVEAATSKGTTIDQVAEQVLGKNNFSALHGKVAIVTGASSGLGLQNARVLQKYGCHVIWAVRDTEKGQKCLVDLRAQEGDLSGKVTVLQVDLSDLTTVKPFVKSFLSLKLPLHMLILNAGVMSPMQWEPSKQGLEIMFATNVLGHYLMSECLMPKMEETAKTDEVRVVILSSVAASMCSNIDLSTCPASKEEYHAFGDYCVTKAFASFQARYLQKKYQGQNIYACAVHPGVIETNLLSHNDSYGKLLFKSSLLSPFRKNIQQGSATTLYCALSMEIPKQIHDGYFFYYNCGPRNAEGITKVGAADHLVEACDTHLRELVKQYIGKYSL